MRIVCSAIICISFGSASVETSACSTQECGDLLADGEAHDARLSLLQGSVHLAPSRAASLEPEKLLASIHHNAKREFEKVDRLKTGLDKTVAFVDGAIDKRGYATCAPLKNEGTHFTVEVQVGTPGQKFDVVADTGSNALIVTSCVCQESGSCAQISGRCFRGVNRSSTFDLPEGPDGPTAVDMLFGSGPIEAVVASDVAQVGSLSAMLNNSLLLMVSQQLNFGMRFEGILGLGLPVREDEPKTEMTKENATAGNVVGQEATANIIGQLEAALGGAGGGVTVMDPAAIMGANPSGMTGSNPSGMMGANLANLSEADLKAMMGMNGGDFLEPEYIAANKAGNLPAPAETIPLLSEVKPARAKPTGHVLQRQLAERARGAEPPGGQAGAEQIAEAIPMGTEQIADVIPIGNLAGDTGATVIPLGNLGNLGASGSGDILVPAEAAAGLAAAAGIDVPAEAAPVAEDADVKGFMDFINYKSFSMCFNEGQNGVLRLGIPKAEISHGTIGKEHWGLELRGLSVGDVKAETLSFCQHDDLPKGQKTACAAIPDSGTTALMAPKDHILKLYDSLCDGWDRCKQNYTALRETTDSAKKVAIDQYRTDPWNLPEATKSLVFQKLIFDCGHWLEKGDGLKELPDINLHVRGANGKDQPLTLTSWAYVIEEEQPADLYDYIHESIPGLGLSKVAVNKEKTVETRKICSPAFAPIEYASEKNGPVWIVGTPIFYEYQVGYDLSNTPAEVSFVQGKCGACAGANASKSLELVQDAKTARSQPRRVRKPFRMPTFDLKKRF